MSIKNQKLAINKSTNIEEKEYQEYRLLCDVLYEYQSEQSKLDDTINALKNNPSYRALFSKDYLEKKEKEKNRIDLIIKALNYLRWDEK